MSEIDSCQTAVEDPGVVGSVSVPLEPLGHGISANFVLRSSSCETLSSGALLLRPSRGDLEKIWEILAGLQACAKERDARVTAPRPLGVVGSGIEAWQPIETAPKDGTHILGRLVHLPDSAGYGGHIEAREIWWRDGVRGIFGEAMTWHAGDDFESGHLGYGDCHYGSAVPTHWMPLPQPPNARVAAPALPQAGGEFETLAPAKPETQEG